MMFTRCTRRLSVCELAFKAAGTETVCPACQRLRESCHKAPGRVEEQAGQTAPAPRTEAPVRSHGGPLRTVLGKHTIYTAEGIVLSDTVHQVLAELGYRLEKI